MVSTIPPKAIQDNAIRGLSLFAEHGRGGMSVRDSVNEILRSPIDDAKLIASGKELSADLIEAMSNFAKFKQYTDSTKYHQDGGLSAAYISWLMMGGDEAMLEWAPKTLITLDNEKTGNLMPISTKELLINDYVSWQSSGGIAYGRIVREVTNGTLEIPETDFTLEGTEEEPAYLIRVYVREEDGEFEETDTYVGHIGSSLTRISNLDAEEESPEEIEDEFACMDGMVQTTGTIKESKTFAFNITETKEIELEGIKYGIVRGYASTYGNVDRGNDRVVSGAFNKSIARYKQNSRPIKMYFNHDSNEIIGGFPVDKIKDDINGLYVEGQINLEVQKGREAYALAKQGVMQDFSIGYTVEDYDLKNGVRELKQLELWEISMVGEPMNTEARIMSVKNNDVKQIKLKDVETIQSKRDLEKLLRESGMFSKKAAVYISSLLQIKQSDSVIQREEFDELKNLINFIKGKSHDSFK